MGAMKAIRLLLVCKILKTKPKKYPKKPKRKKKLEEATTHLVRLYQTIISLNKEVDQAEKECSD